jgi:hypothetical protein
MMSTPAYGFDDGTTPGTNRSAPATSCHTCGGDRFVTVRLRSPEQTAWMQEKGIKPNPKEFYEEVAPCPDCNNQTVEYFTVNGRFRSMDAAATRQAMTQ